MCSFLCCVSLLQSQKERGNGREKDSCNKILGFNKCMFHLLRLTASILCLYLSHQHVTASLLLCVPSNRYGCIPFLSLGIFLIFLEQIITKMTNGTNIQGEQETRR